MRAVLNISRVEASTNSHRKLTAVITMALVYILHGLSPEVLLDKT